MNCVRLITLPPYVPLEPRYPHEQAEGVAAVRQQSHRTAQKETQFKKIIMISRNVKRRYPHEQAEGAVAAPPPRLLV